MEAVGEREKVVVLVMGKMRDTGRMVVKDSKTGETVLGELPKKTFVNHPVPAVIKPQQGVLSARPPVSKTASNGALLLDCFLIRGKNDRAMYRLGLLFEMEKALWLTEEE